VSSDIAMAPMVGGEVAPSSAYRQALTRRGYVSEVNFLEPEDGGLAELFVNDEGCVFDLKIFTPDIASAMFELAVDARLVIYTCGTPLWVLTSEEQRQDLPAGTDPDDVAISDSASRLFELLSPGYDEMAAWRARVISEASEARSP